MSRLLLTAVVAATAVAPLSAQERPRLGFEIGSTRYSKMLHDDSSPSVGLSAYRPLSFTARFTTHIKRVGFGLSVSRSWVDLGSRDGSGFTVVQEREMTLFEVSPEARVAVFQNAAGARIYLHGGLVIDHWNLKNVGGRSRMGPILGGTVSGNLGNRWSLDLRTDLTFTASPINEDELSSGLHRDPQRRLRLAAGLSRGL